MAEFQETGQERMEGKDVSTPFQSLKLDGTNCASEGNVDDVDMETDSQADGGTTKQELMESDDKESVLVTDSGKTEDSRDIKESNEKPEELSNQHQEENKDIDQEKKDNDHEMLQDNCDDQERSGDAVNQSQEDQSSLQETSESNQKSPQNDQAGPVNPEEKFSDQPLGNKPEQSNQSDQSTNDHETVDDQMEATSQQDDQNLKTQNANSDIKTDQDEESPSTPPHTTPSASVDSQATEIISTSDGSHGSGDDKNNGQQSSEDEAEESQYGRPWYNFWSSSDRPAKKRKVTITRKPSVWSARDTLAYRDGYPGKKDNKKIDKNLKFYRNQISSYPYGDYIDVIHEKWWSDYQLLEYNHSYIQWLFPIREQGLNMHAEVLQLHEAKAICSDPVAHGRILKSYKMMLDFYGVRLCNEKTGEVERAENWKERFHHLNHSMHNYLRITRILKCLGEMKLEHLKAPFVRYLLYEIISEQTLYNCLDSCINYWLQVIKDDQEREDLLEYAESLARETRSTTTTTGKSQAGAEGVTKEKTDSQLKKETQSTKKETQSAEKETQSTKKETQLTKKESQAGAEGVTKGNTDLKREAQLKKETQSTKKETQSAEKETQPTQPNKGKQQKNESQAQPKKPLKQSKLNFFKKK